MWEKILGFLRRNCVIFSFWTQTFFDDQPEIREFAVSFLGEDRKICCMYLAKEGDNRGKGERI